MREQHGMAQRTQSYDTFRRSSNSPDDHRKLENGVLSTAICSGVLECHAMTRSEGECVDVV